MSCPFCDNPDKNPQITIQVSPPIDWPREFCQFIEQLQTDRLNVEMALRQDVRRLRESLGFWRHKAQDLMLSGHSSGRYEEQIDHNSGQNTSEIPRPISGDGRTSGLGPEGAGGKPDVPTNFERLLTNSVDELITLYSISAENLTQDQVASALKQAILAGDFQRLISSSGGQTVVYLPFARVQELEGRIRELEHELEDEHNRQS